MSQIIIDEQINLKRCFESIRSWITVRHYVTSDPEINRGKLTFKGTRILVETVLTALEKDGKMEPIFARYPKLSREAIQEAVELASKALVTPFEPGHDRKLKLPA